jgi:hypothetical protein
MAVTFNPFTGNLDFVGAGAAATPGGSDTQVQFNDDGAFGGDAGLVFNKSTNKLTAGGDIELNDGGANTLTLQTVTPTAARTISFPDATGTVGLVAGSTGQLVFNDAGAYAGVSTATVSSGNITLTGRFISSLNGALSATGIAGVPVALTGTWIAAGGTATTTKPQFLIEPSGATSTAWSTSGTGFGVNAASGFAGNLLDLQVNGTSQLKVNQQGDITSGGGNVSVPDSRAYTWFSRGSISAPLDGTFRLRNNNGTTFSMLRFGGDTTSFPGLKRNSAVLETKLADDTDYAQHAAAVFEAAKAYTVATLPGTPVAGMIARVTDATAPAVGSTVAGGGAAAALVWYNGANWSVIGV